MGVQQQLRAVRKGMAAAMEARRATGISIWRQAREAITLRRNGVGLDDYYYYRLYDPVLHPNLEDKLTYGGWRAFQGEFRSYSRPQQQAIAYEKHIFYRLCEAFDLPVPHIYGVYSPTPAGFERHRAITDRAALARFLVDTDKLPIFGKPSSASQGYGCRGIMARDDQGRFKLLAGGWITLDALVDDIHAIATETGTYLLCEFLRNADEIAVIAGEAVCSFRVVMLVRDGEPEFFRTSIRFPGIGSQTSNVLRFASGTVSCALDVQTGEITLALSGGGANRREASHHPVSGAPLLGHRIAGWDEIRSLALEASRAMTPFRMQHWDFALTTRGPVIMEMNFIGDVTACQMHGPPGIYTEQYVSFRDTHAY